MDRVVAFRELPGDVDHLQADDLQATVLVSGEDPAGQEALDAVGLDQDEGSFVHVSSRVGSESVVSGSPSGSSGSSGSESSGGSTEGVGASSTVSRPAAAE